MSDNGHLSAFIDDGYSLKGKIFGKGLHPDVTIGYRPMTKSQTAQTQNAVVESLDRGDGKEVIVASKTICSQVFEWDLGRKIDVTNVQRLHPSLFERMYAIVMGRDVPDEFLGDEEYQNQEEAEKNSAVASG